LKIAKTTIKFEGANVLHFSKSWGGVLSGIIEKINTYYYPIQLIGFSIISNMILNYVEEGK